MAQVVIPNRPLGTDIRSIEAILANFDAVTAQTNGNLDSTNIANSLAQSARVNTTTQAVKGVSYLSAADVLIVNGYSVATHPDRVTGITLAASGLLRITARFDLAKGADPATNNGIWFALFVGGTEVASPFGNTNAGNLAFCEHRYLTDLPASCGCVGGTGIGPGSNPSMMQFGASCALGSGTPSDLFPTAPQVVGMPIDIAAPAGIYNVELRYKCDPSVVGSVSQRLLYVEAISFS